MNRPTLSRRPLAALGLLLVSGFAAPAGFAAEAPSPPAAQRPHEVKAPHGAVRNDEYYWLRDDKRENPEMLAYLNAENAYADAMLAPLAPLKQRLYDEIVGRIQQDDASVPYLEDGYWYYTRFESGKDYPITARRKGTMDAPEEILRPERDGRRQGLLPGRHLGSEPGRHQARVGRGPQRPAPVHDQGEGHRQRRGAGHGDHRRLGEHRLGRRQQDALVCRERPDHPVDDQGQDARARYAGERGQARLHRDRQQLLHGHRSHALEAVHLHRREQHRVVRAALHQGRQPGRVHRDRAARARRRVRRRPLRRALGDHHQLECAQLPPDDRRRGCPRQPRGLEGTRAARQ